MFDEQPDADPHGECALEIKRLTERVTALVKECHDYQDRVDELTESTLLLSRQLPGAVKEVGLTALSGSPLDGLADKHGSRWGALDEMGWSFEQHAFKDFCAEFAAAIRAGAEPISPEPEAA